ncbi:hypothetical protein PG990_012281 [Apiospora arundinis]
MEGTLFTQTDDVGPHTTFWLPPQITPFTPPYTCSITALVHCVLTSDYCTANYLERYASATRLWGSSVHECFPSGFYEISKSWLVPCIRFPTTNHKAQPDTKLSVAYQGTACLSGWHRACETTFQLDGLPYSQAWCCPPGQYECFTTTSSDRIVETFSAKRACMSYVTALTSYHLDGELDGAIMVQNPSGVAYSTLPPGKTYRYVIEAFPLQIPATPISSTSTESRVTPTALVTIKDTYTANAAAPTNGLEKEHIVGISIGILLFLGLVAAMVVMQIRRRRRRNQRVAVDDGYNPYQGKPELPNNIVLRAELGPATDGLVAELEGHRMYPEMDAQARPVEAPEGGRWHVEEIEPSIENQAS